MITASAPTQDINIGDIVIAGENFIMAHTPFLKYRVTSFLKLESLATKQHSFICGLRVKWDKRHGEFVSFGQEHTLISCFKMTKDDFWLLIGQRLTKSEYALVPNEWQKEK